jgi:2-polyprenyl-3-methyl-5-hydroxy-6-metoxy-1,4-benzoquinol methylase
MANKTELEKKKMYFYESFADEFDSKMNMYDTNKRLQVFYSELLTEDISGKKLLDAGCGTGWFSKIAVDRGAHVTSMDLGENLLTQVKMKCNSIRVIGSILEMPFEDDSFDLVVSSEVIEHTPEPFKALEELHRVLKPGGVLVISTPNKLWYPAVAFANLFRLRPYQGLENWTSWWSMKNQSKTIGFSIEKMVGVHAFPFVHPVVYPILDILHGANSFLGPIMLNIALRARKNSIV